MVMMIMFGSFALGLVLGGKTNVGTSSRDEDDILGHGSCALVMLRVGHLPCLVRNQESRVENPSKNSVDCLAVRESSMAAL